MVLSAQTYDTSSGFPISSKDDAYIESDNKFLFFDRAPSGTTVLNYDGNEVAVISYKKHRFDGNLFLYMNRSCSGYTVFDIDELESGYTEGVYSMNTFYGDIYNNALAFMVKDDGSIGYRYLVKDCEEGAENPYKVLEGNSLPDVVKKGQWTSIRVRIRENDGGMKMMFYVDGKLKYITKSLPMLNLRMLDELSEKQEGVAYNISIGGGTQGLAETIMPEYQMKPVQSFPIEENFAGTFIGDIRKFDFYSC
jgi:hypothetical protein